VPSGFNRNILPLADERSSASLALSASSNAAINFPSAATRSDADGVLDARAI
jgi:hypothetical protein